MRVPETKLDLMSGAQQVRLTNKVSALFQEFREQEGLSVFAILYWLIAYTWGYAKACQWSTNNLKDFAARQYEACERAEAAAHEERKLTIVG